jgi:alkylation response protein AidB-like acyl-CoA dehydrogenase
LAEEETRALLGSCVVVEFDQVLVPEENVLGALCEGWPILERVLQRPW